MQLAKAEGGGLVTVEPYDIIPVIYHVIDEYRRESEQVSQIELIVPEQVVITTIIDMDAFAIILRNLIENALKYRRENTNIRIALSEDRRLRVINERKIVDPVALCNLKKRFARAVSFKPGVGLGLAIVDAIIRGSEGELSLYSPATELQDGFEVVIQLP